MGESQSTIALSHYLSSLTIPLRAYKSIELF